MTGLRIYGVARTRAFRALWVAKELGIPYEHMPIEIGDAGARTPEFLALNPNGRLPVIVDGDFVLSESLAITLYLAKKYSQRKALSRHSSKTRRGCGNGAFGPSPRSIAASISGRCMRCACRPQERNAALREEALKVIASPFKVLDTAVAQQPYLLGDDFTIADLNVAAVISRAVDMDLSAWPSLKAWLDALSRPAGGARGARAQDQIRQRYAGRSHPAHRTDQSPMSRALQYRPSDERSHGAHGQGRLRDAEKIYTRVLKAAPDNFDALNLLGTVKAQQGHIGEAHRLFNAAVKANPRAPQGWSNLGQALHALKRSARKRSNVSTKRARLRPTTSTFSISTPIRC